MALPLQRTVKAIEETREFVSNLEQELANISPKKKQTLVYEQLNVVTNELLENIEELFKRYRRRLDNIGMESGEEAAITSAAIKEAADAMAAAAASAAEEAGRQAEEAAIAREEELEEEIEEEEQEQEEAAAAAAAARQRITKQQQQQQQRRSAMGYSVAPPAQQKTLIGTPISKSQLQNMRDKLSSIKQNLSSLSNNPLPSPAQVPSSPLGSPFQSPVRVQGCGYSSKDYGYNKRKTHYHHYDDEPDVYSRSGSESDEDGEW